MNQAGCDYGRTTITVPRQLKRRMKAVGQHVNWSAVACRAFQAKLAELSMKEDAETLETGAHAMEAALKRLRRLRQEGTASDQYKRGRDVGRDWGMKAATPDQLDRLDAFRLSMSDSEWLALFRTDRGWRLLAREIEPGRKRAKLVWRRIVEEEETEDLDFFRGFADAAVAFWREVKPRL